MIGIIDYGMGNVGSIYNMLNRIGSNSIICDNANKLENCKKIILPGVGSFDNAISKLNSKGFVEIIEKKTKAGDYFLGVCLGMQLLGTTSEEGQGKGLNIIPGKIKKIPKSETLKGPHMGWNNVDFKNDEIGISLNTNRFYFVHRYYFSPEDNKHIAGTTYYGISFASCIKKDNIIGVQFHPEKSHKYGMALLNNFVNLK